MALHSIAANYEPAANNSAEEFLRSVPFLLPCGYCGWHFHQQLQAANLTTIVSSRSNLEQFLVDAHNHVTANKNQLGASTPPTRSNWTLAEVQAKYAPSSCVAELDIVWDGLHLLAAGYHVPDGTNWSHGSQYPLDIYRHQATKFIESLPLMLPCSTSTADLSSLLGSLSQIVSQKSNFNQFFVDAHKLFNSTTVMATLSKAKEVYFDGWSTACVSETREWLETNLYDDVTNASGCPNYIADFNGACGGAIASCADDSSLGPRCPQR
jgi:hypothetical protein